MIRSPINLFHDILGFNEPIFGSKRDPKPLFEVFMPNNEAQRAGFTFNNVRYRMFPYIERINV